MFTVLDTVRRLSDIPRDTVVILTKCYFAVDTYDKNRQEGLHLNNLGLSRKHILDAVDDSVRRLGTHIDLLQIHRYDPNVPDEEVMRALNDVVESGKVRYLGASSMKTYQFIGLQHTAELNGWHKFVSMQSMYNLIYREDERELNAYCNHAGIGLLPWSPNARGLLALPWTSAKIQEKLANPEVYGLNYMGLDVEHDKPRSLVKSTSVPWQKSQVLGLLQRALILSLVLHWNKPLMQWWPWLTPISLRRTLSTLKSHTRPKCSYLQVHSNTLLNHQR